MIKLLLLITTGLLPLIHPTPRTSCVPLRIEYCKILEVKPDNGTGLQLKTYNPQ